ncbi:permease prefix domain 1-containing protein [Metabacillus litoralis]|uniref:permease prefix domain 1-containing protein n=1 Tax=Metabacillus litoralis TaxID=152268 RepID=UPI00203BBADF|nr:permease prefix domain 1-containing protein [Metabacillus litoralis]MCM3412667.1 permease prefix domain 1-containing protein [Metabacillus litoralis]
MKQIDKYVNSIYKDVAGDKQEIEDLKQEMRSHLVEAVEELKAKGKTEEEAIRIAIENFGGKNQIVKGLSEFFKVQKKFTNYVLSFALIFFVFGIITLVSSWLEAEHFYKKGEQYGTVETEKKAIFNEVFDVLDTTNKISDAEEEQLMDIFNKYPNQLNLLAVFPAEDLKGWLEKNEVLIGTPMTHFPIEYKYAGTVIGNNKIIENKEQIMPSDYDLGTVIMAKGHWIVQYEYKTSYENIIEEHHQLNYYAPNTWTFYQLPILFFVLFIALGIVWLFLKKQNKQLKTVIN